MTVPILRLVGKPLTRRELEALVLKAKGLQSPEVAGVMGVSRFTVDDFVKSARAKLEADTFGHALVIAMQRGLIWDQFPIKPVDMILFCPACGRQHIDGPEGEGPDGATTARLGAWTNPPHRSHLCHYCGHIWRPADIATNGVAEIRTKGKQDSPVKLPALKNLAPGDPLDGTA